MAYTIYQWFICIFSIGIVFLCIYCILLIRKHESFRVCYYIIGLVAFNNIAFVINQIVVALTVPNHFWLVVEAVLFFMVNLQCLVNIIFVQRQWITTRNQLYRQEFLPSKKAEIRSQIRRHNCVFYSMQAFYITALFVLSIMFFKVNETSYTDSSCYQEGLKHCSDEKFFTAINWTITIFLVITIFKNVIMSSIMFLSLYRFYRGLRTINIDFNIDKCVLTMHIIAFGLPILSGIAWLILFAFLNQVAIFASSKATSKEWSVLAPSIAYCTIMGCVQVF